jgi:hypothetical protein
VTAGSGAATVMRRARRRRTAARGDRREDADACDDEHQREQTPSPHGSAASAPGRRQLSLPELP